MSSDPITTLFYGDSQSYESYLKLRALKEKNSTINPHKKACWLGTTSSGFYEEAKALLELIKLHRKGEINLVEDHPNISNLTPHSRALEIHFNLFRNICLTFSDRSNAQVLKEMIDRVDLLGSVLFEEFDLEKGTREDEVKTIATFDPQTKKLVLTMPPNRAKVCQFYTPFSSHVIIFARIKLRNSLTDPHPFLVELRNKRTLELQIGIKEEWIGGSRGNLSNCEYSFVVNGLEIGPETLLLNKYLNINNGLEFYGDDENLSYYRRVCLLQQQIEDMNKSIHETLKMAVMGLEYVYDNVKTENKDTKEKKTKIVEVKTELLNMLLTVNEMRRIVREYAEDAQKNFVFLAELFVIYDAYAAFISQTCLKSMETLLTVLNSLGFVGTSSISCFIENSTRNAGNLGAYKDLRYVKLVDSILQTNMERKGPFLQTYATLLTEREESNVFSKVPNFEKDVFVLAWLLGRNFQRVIHQKRQLAEKECFHASQDFKKFLETTPDLKSINEFCDTFLGYLTHTIAHKVLENHKQSQNSKLMQNLLLCYVQKILLRDEAYLISEEGKVLENNATQTLKANHIECLMTLKEQSLSLTKLLDIDEKSINSYFPAQSDLKDMDFKKLSEPTSGEEGQKQREKIREEVMKLLSKPVNPRL